MEILLLKPLETGNLSSGNKSLSFLTVLLRYGDGYRPGIMTNAWKLPEECHHLTDVDKAPFLILWCPSLVENGQSQMRCMEKFEQDE